MTRISDKIFWIPNYLFSFFPHYNSDVFSFIYTVSTHSTQCSTDPTEVHVRHSVNDRTRAVLPSLHLFVKLGALYNFACGPFLMALGKIAASREIYIV